MLFYSKFQLNLLQLIMILLFYATTNNKTVLL